MRSHLHAPGSFRQPFSPEAKNRAELCAAGGVHSGCGGRASMKRAPLYFALLSITLVSLSAFAADERNPYATPNATTNASAYNVLSSGTLFIVRLDDTLDTARFT